MFSVYQYIYSIITIYVQVMIDNSLDTSDINGGFWPSPNTFDLSRPSDDYMR